MAGKLSSRELAVACALAASFAPPTSEHPETPDDVGFAARFEWFFGHLPLVERFLLHLFLRFVYILPVLLFFKAKSFPSLSADERRRFVDKLFDSYGMLGRIIAKFDGVRFADVVIDIPDTIGFGKTHVRPSAAVQVVMEGRKQVDQKLVEAFAGLVSSAVAEIVNRTFVPESST